MYEAGRLPQIWKDGEMVVDRLGANPFNDQEGHYMKWTVYKEWKNPNDVEVIDTQLLFDHDLLVDDESVS